MNIVPSNAQWFLSPFYYKLDTHKHLVIYRNDTHEWQPSSHDSLVYFLKEEGLITLVKYDIRKITIQSLISRFGITSKQANRMMDADVIKLEGLSNGVS
jgi:hypothetical protein